jgi:hypothetical protein
VRNSSDIVVIFEIDESCADEGIVDVFVAEHLHDVKDISVLLYSTVAF